MKRRRRPGLDRLLLPLALLAAPALRAELTPTEWAHRQPFEVPAPGLVRVELPAATFDTAQPGLADLRLVDADGRELPYLLDQGGHATADDRPRPLKPRAVTINPGADSTQLLIETGTNLELERVNLETAAPFFLKAAHVDLSDDGQEWRPLGAAVPVFRQFGAAQLALGLERQKAAFVRVTVDDLHAPPVAFTGAQLWTKAPQPPPAALAPVEARIVRRDEFAGETVLTIALAGRRVPLLEIGLEIRDALFMRPVTVTAREARGATASERGLGGGTVYRVALANSAAQARTTVPIVGQPSENEVLVHIHNGDSPPLQIDAVRAAMHPTSLLFMAANPGRHLLLTGNPQATAPHYDLAAFAGELRAAGGTVVVPGAPEDTPHYQPRESLAGPALPDVPLTGAPLDTRDWAQRRAVQLARPGVQELELDPAALAGAQADGADLRLLHGGNQIPYVLERPNLGRALAVNPVAAPDPKRAHVSIWQLPLPVAGLPVRRLVLASPTRLFQRELRIYERVEGADGVVRDHSLATLDWSRRPEPGVPEARTVELTEPPSTRTVLVETDNGDNPAIELGPVQVVYPVVRLIFKVADTDGYVLAYGNRTAAPPRYDLGLVADRLLTASRSPAQLEAGSAAAEGARPWWQKLDRGVVFWAALGLVVVALLAVVARLLPKPPAA